MAPSKTATSSPKPANAATNKASGTVGESDSVKAAEQLREHAGSASEEHGTAPQGHIAHTEGQQREPVVEEPIVDHEAHDREKHHPGGFVQKGGTVSIVGENQNAYPSSLNVIDDEDAPAPINVIPDNIIGE